MSAAFAQLAAYFRACRGLGYVAQPAYEEHRIAGLRSAGIDVAPLYAVVAITDPRYAR